MSHWKGIVLAALCLKIKWSESKEEEIHSDDMQVKVRHYCSRTQITGAWIEAEFVFSLIAAYIKYNFIKSSELTGGFWMEVFPLNERWSLATCFPYFDGTGHYWQHWHITSQEVMQVHLSLRQWKLFLNISFGLYIYIYIYNQISELQTSWWGYCLKLHHIKSIMSTVKQDWGSTTSWYDAALCVPNGRERAGNPKWLITFIQRMSCYQDGGTVQATIFVDFPEILYVFQNNSTKWMACDMSCGLHFVLLKYLLLVMLLWSMLSSNICLWGLFVWKLPQTQKLTLPANQICFLIQIFKTNYQHCYLQVIRWDFCGHHQFICISYPANEVGASNFVCWWRSFPAQTRYLALQTSALSGHGAVYFSRSAMSGMILLSCSDALRLLRSRCCRCVFYCEWHNRWFKIWYEQSVSGLRLIFSNLDLEMLSDTEPLIRQANKKSFFPQNWNWIIGQKLESLETTHLIIPL